MHKLWQEVRTLSFDIKQFRRRRRWRKHETSGRDLVFYCGQTKHQWHAAEPGGFGSEEAVINLSRALISRGWKITVYNNCGQDPVFSDGVIYRPLWEFNPSDKLKRRVPEAKLHWAYGWNLFEDRERKNRVALEWMKRTQEELDAAGIVGLGHLSHAEVGRLYQQAAILAYPTEFVETDCISVKKAQAAGCIPITTDIGALNESVQFGIKIPVAPGQSVSRLTYGLRDPEAQQRWIDAAVEMLLDQRRRDELGSAGIAWAQSLGWDDIAQRWHEALRAAGVGRF